MYRNREHGIICSPTAKKHDKAPRDPRAWLNLRGVTRNNLDKLDVDIPLGVFTSVTGISGSGKSSLISQFLVETAGDMLGHRIDSEDETTTVWKRRLILWAARSRRLGRDQATGRGRSKANRPYAAVEPRDLYRPASITSANSSRRPSRPAPGATMRAVFRSTSRRADARPARAKGLSCVELLFLPSVYAPCPTCKGARYNAKTLEIKIRDNSIADVLAMTVDGAFDFFADDAVAAPITGRASRGRLGLHSAWAIGYRTFRRRGPADQARHRTAAGAAGRDALRLDEPTTGLHPSDVAKLMTQLHGLVDVRQHGYRRRTRHVASQRPATGSSISGPGRETRAARSSLLGRRCRRNLVPMAESIALRGAPNVGGRLLDLGDLRSGRRHPRVSCRRPVPTATPDPAIGKRRRAVLPGMADVRLAMGGVAHKPWRAWKAEGALRGQQATSERFRAAAEAELAEASGLTIGGELAFPKGNGPFPVVILLHPCGGLDSIGLATLQAHSRALWSNGFGTLILDSYGPRNLARGKACETFPTGFLRRSDAFNAIAALQSQAKISADNIFLLGLSDGGNAAIISARGGGTAGHFRAVAAYYPACEILLGGMVAHLPLSYL